MEKDKAIQIIVEEYQNGYSPTDIAQNLSQQLGAPFELVYKFVMKTLDEEVEISRPSVTEESIPLPAAPITPKAVMPPLPGYEPVPAYEPEPEEEPVAPDSPFKEANDAPAFALTTAPDLKSLEQNPKVEKFVLQMLASNRKSSDTVLAVCERTGLSWDEAQRLVARIAAKNHKSLKSKQNRVPMILSVIALLGGALLVFAGISEAYNIYTVVQTMPSGEEMLMAAASQEFLRSTFWSLFMGGALLLGGTAGLFFAMRAQFE